MLKKLILVAMVLVPTCAGSYVVGMIADREIVMAVEAIGLFLVALAAFVYTLLDFIYELVLEIRYPEDLRLSPKSPWPAASSKEEVNR